MTWSSTRTGSASGWQQGAPPYTLEIPVVVSGADGATEHVVVLDKTLDHFEIPVQRPQRVSIDPDYHLFRRLDPQEIEPTLSQVLAVEMPVVVLDGATAEMTAAARTFAEDFTEMEMPPVVENGQLPADIPARRTACQRGDQSRSRAGGPIQPTRGWSSRARRCSWRASAYSLDDYDLVYCAANPFDRRLTDLVIHSASPRRVQALARRLGHYGKYSWLLLPTGQGRVLRGNWQPPGSPLTAEKSGA